MLRSANGEERYGPVGTALEGFTKESFEADGKRREIYRAGHGPAVIIISEMPGITPLVAEIREKGRGRRVARR